jgi:hypothetical protein
MITLLLGLTLALPATTRETRFELSAAANLAYHALHWNGSGSFPPLDGRSLGGSGTVGLTVFGRRIVDDDAAPPLQPFLQRSPRFHLGGSGGSSDVTYPTLALSPVEPARPFVRLQGTRSAGHVDLSGDGYIGHWFYLGAAFAVDYTTWEYRADGVRLSGSRPPQLPSSQLQLAFSVAIGVRWRDVLVAAGWGLTPRRLDDGDLNVPFYGGAFVSLDSVVRRWIELSANVSVRPGGAVASGLASFWLGRRLGLLVGAGGGHDSDGGDFAGGQIGVQYWVRSRWAATLSYAPTWQRANGSANVIDSSVAHLVMLTLTARPR